MKTFMLITWLSLPALAHAYDPCWGYMDSEKANCYRQYQEQEQRNTEMRQQTNQAMQNQLNQDNANFNAANADYQIQQQNNQLKALLDAINR